MIESTEIRWAIKHVKMNRLLGKFCWEDAREADGKPRVPTFKTREDARKAKKTMSSYGNASKVVKVAVRTTEIL